MIPKTQNVLNPQGNMREGTESLIQATKHGNVKFVRTLTEELVHEELFKQSEQTIQTEPCKHSKTEAGTNTPLEQSRN